MHPVWGASLKHLKRSLYGEQVLISIVDEYVGSGETGVEGQAEWERLQECCRHSTHFRNAAIGDLIRLHFIHPAQRDEVKALVTSAVSSLYAAKRVDREAESQFIKMSTQVARHWHSLALKWHSQRKYWLAKSAHELRDVVPQAVWLEARRRAD